MSSGPGDVWDWSLSRLRSCDAVAVSWKFLVLVVRKSVPVWNPSSPVHLPSKHWTSLDFLAFFPVSSLLRINVTHWHLYRSLSLGLCDLSPGCCETRAHLYAAVTVRSLLHCLCVLTAFPAWHALAFTSSKQLRKARGTCGQQGCTRPAEQAMCQSSTNKVLLFLLVFHHLPYLLIFYLKWQNHGLLIWCTCIFDMYICI